MTWLIGFAASLLGPKFERFAKPVVFGLLAVLIVGALWGGKCAYDSHVIAQHAAKEEAKQAKRERKADANLEQQKDRDAAAAEQRQQEIDDATRNIPDQAPSARQRARACLELRRQAKAHRRPEPAC
jgi:hypothetical protein